MSVYEPSEDSFLLERNIPKNLKGRKVLEIGCGSGILSVKAAENRGIVTAVDINENALEATKKLASEKNVRLNLVKSDLFEKINDKYDLILFNPPYVACKKEGLIGEEAWAGGFKGRKVIDLFLKEFKDYLSENAEVLLLISSQNEMKEELESEGWKCADFLKLSGEELFVMKFNK